MPVHHQRSDALNSIKIVSVTAAMEALIEEAVVDV